MHRIKLFISIFIFAILLGVTSFIKTQTRLIEKKIEKDKKKVAILKKDFNETQLDFFYLSSPENILKKITYLDINEYHPMDFSRMYLSYEEFLNSQRKITNLNINNEKKTKKK